MSRKAAQPMDILTEHFAGLSKKPKFGSDGVQSLDNSQLTLFNSYERSLARMR